MSTNPDNDAVRQLAERHADQTAELAARHRRERDALAAEIGDETICPPRWIETGDDPAPAAERDIDAAFDASSFGPADPRLERYLAEREQARRARTDDLVGGLGAIVDQLRKLRREGRDQHAELLDALAPGTITEPIVTMLDAVAGTVAQHVDDAAEDTAEEIIEAIGHAAPRRRQRVVEGVRLRRWAMRREARENAAQGQDEGTGGR